MNVSDQGSVTPSSLPLLETLTGQADNCNGWWWMGSDVMDGHRMARDGTKLLVVKCQALDVKLARMARMTRIAKITRVVVVGWVMT